MSDTGPFYISGDLPASSSVSAPTEAPEATEPPPVAFSDKVKLPLEGLLYLGRLEKVFNWSGHKFKIRTITNGEVLRTAQVVQPYVGTTEETRAWVIARAAACIISIDDQLLPVPINESESEIEAKFRWCMDQYPWTIDAIHGNLLLLEQTVEEVMQEMGKV